MRSKCGKEQKSQTQPRVRTAQQHHHQPHPHHHKMLGRMQHLLKVGCATSRASMVSSHTRTVTSFALRPRLRRIYQDNTPLEQQEETRVATSPMELIALVPPIEHEGRVAVCDGGSGPTGHPRVFINLDNGKPNPCGYCGLRFVMRDHHHHHSDGEHHDAAH